MAIRVLIADDHALLRQGLKRVLNFEDDIEVVGETEDGQETLARTLVLQPDILLLDLNMPGLNGLDVASQLQAAKCSTKIIALTIHDNDNYVFLLSARPTSFIRRSQSMGSFTSWAAISTFSYAVRFDIRL